MIFPYVRKTQKLKKIHSVVSDVWILGLRIKRDGDLPSIATDSIAMQHELTKLQDI